MNDTDVSSFFYHITLFYYEDILSCGRTIPKYRYYIDFISKHSFCRMTMTGIEEWNDENVPLFLEEFPFQKFLNDGDV